MAPSGFCGVSYIGYRCVVVLNLVGYRLGMFFLIRCGLLSGFGFSESFFRLVF